MKPHTISRAQECGWCDTDYSIRTYPANANEPLPDWIARVRVIADTKCRYRAYAKGVMRRCDEFTKNGK